MTVHNDEAGVPETMGPIVDRWLKQSGLKHGLRKYKIFAAWNQIIDDDMREHVEPVRFVKQILEINVDSPPLYFELVGFHKKNLLKKLQKKSPLYVKDIRFVCSGQKLPK